MVEQGNFSHAGYGSQDGFYHFRAARFGKVGDTFDEWGGHICLLKERQNYNPTRQNEPASHSDHFEFLFLAGRSFYFLFYPHRLIPMDEGMSGWRHQQQPAYAKSG